MQFPVENTFCHEEETSCIDLEDVLDLYLYVCVPFCSRMSYTYISKSDFLRYMVLETSTTFKEILEIRDDYLSE